MDRRRHHDIADSAYQLQRAAGRLQQLASGPGTVAALPTALAHLEEAVERVATSVVKAAQAVEEDPVTAESPAESRALRWHMHHFAARLLGARDACPEARRWARELTRPEPAVEAAPAGASPTGVAAAREADADAPVVLVAVDGDLAESEDVAALLAAARERLHDIDGSLRVETISGPEVSADELIEMARDSGAGLVAVDEDGDVLVVR